MTSVIDQLRSRRSQTGTPLTARRALMLLFLGSGVRCLFVAHQEASAATTLTVRLLGAACLVISAGLVRVDIRIQGPVGQVLVASLIAVTTVLVGLAPDRGDAVLRAFGYPWSALFAALYLSRQAARTYSVLASAAFAVAISFADLPRMLSAWALVTVTVVAVTAATSGLVAALRLQSEADPLTGIANRAGFTRLATQALASAARQRQTVAVLICDIDGLKQVNDSGGHAAGDGLLRDVASAWMTTLRASDVFARLGGDEFAVLLPNTGIGGAEEAVERLRFATPVAFSAGIAVSSPGEALDAVLARADAAMYANKCARRGNSGVPVQRGPRRLPTPPASTIGR